MVIRVAANGKALPASITLTALTHIMRMRKIIRGPGSELKRSGRRVGESEGWGMQIASAQDINGVINGEGELNVVGSERLSVDLQQYERDGLGWSSARAGGVGGAGAVTGTEAVAGTVVGGAVGVYIDSLVIRDRTC